MALPDLTGLFIQDTYQKLVVIDSDTLSDGVGNELTTISNTSLALTVSSLTATTLTGTLQTAAQTNITSLGTLTSLVIADGGDIGSASDTDAISIAANGVVTFSQNITGTLGTAAQTNITSLGTLTGLTVGGVVDITDTTDASDDTGDTGALRVEGGVSIAKKLYVGTDLTVTGNFTVNGTTTTVNTTNTTITDTLIELNSGAGSNSNDSGLIIERGSTGDNAIFIWDESRDEFNVGTTTATADSTGNVSYTLADFRADDISVGGNGAKFAAATEGIQTNKRFAIGTSLPTASLHVKGDDSGDGLPGLKIEVEGSNAIEVTDLSTNQGTLFKVDDIGNIEFSMGSITNSSSNMHIISSVQDKDMLFRGNDGGTTITALTLDMSEGGVATFVNDVNLGEEKKLYFDGGLSTYISEVSADSLHVVVGGQTVLKLTEAGGNQLDSVITQAKVGIGVTTATAKLHVKSDVNTNMAALKIEAGGNNAIEVTDMSTNQGTLFKVDDVGDVSIESGAAYRFNQTSETYLYEFVSDQVVMKVGNINLMKWASGTRTVLLDGEVGNISTSLHFGTGQDGRIFVKDDDFYIEQHTEDKDIIFRGNDGNGVNGYNINALTLDMSEAGTAIFNHDIVAPATGKIYLDGGSDTYIVEDSGNLVKHVVGNIQLLQLRKSSATNLLVRLPAEHSSNEGTKLVFGAGSDGELQTVADDFYMRNVTQDKDIIFQGNDGGATITSLTLDMSEAGAATFNSSVTAGSAGFIVGNATLTTSELDISSGDFTLDVEGDITFDANGADVILADDGTEFGRFKRDTSDFVIKSATNNKDIIFKGVDNSSTITALTLDMSDAGTAIFNHDIKLSDNNQVILGSSDDVSIYCNSSNDLYIQHNTSNEDVYIRVKDGSTFKNAVSIDSSNNAKVSIYNDLQAGGNLISTGGGGTANYAIGGGQGAANAIFLTPVDFLAATDQTINGGGRATGGWLRQPGYFFNSTAGLAQAAQYIVPVGYKIDVATVYASAGTFQVYASKVTNDDGTLVLSSTAVNSDEPDCAAAESVLTDAVTGTGCGEYVTIFWIPANVGDRLYGAVLRMTSI